MNSSTLPGLRLDLNALRGRRSISPLTYLIAGSGLFLSSFEFELVRTRLCCGIEIRDRNPWCWYLASTSRAESCAQS